METLSKIIFDNLPKVLRIKSTSNNNILCLMNCFSKHREMKRIFDDVAFLLKHPWAGEELSFEIDVDEQNLLKWP